MKLKVLEQGTKSKPHVEIGMQIELVAGKNAFFGARPAADAAVSFEHGDPHAGTRKISGERQPVVACANHDAVEIRHAVPRPRSATR